MDACVAHDSTMEQSEGPSDGTDPTISTDIGGNMFGNEFGADGEDEMLKVNQEESGHGQETKWQMITGNGGNTMYPRGSNTDVDRGYAWVIVLACFSIQFLFTGYMKTSGVLFVEFQNQFHASSAITSLALGVMEGTYSIVAFIFLGFVLKKTGPRFLCLLGSLFLFLGVAGNYFANGVAFLMFTHGVCFGAAIGMTYGTSLIVISDYFVRRRALATSIAMTGASVGGSVLPMLSRYLVVEYGFYGGFLLFGGILTHSFVFSMLLFPAKNSVITDNVKLIQPQANVQDRGKEIPENTGVRSSDFTTEDTKEKAGDSNGLLTQYVSVLPSINLVSSNGKVSEVYQTSSESPHEKNLTINNQNGVNDMVSSSPRDGLLSSEDTDILSCQLSGNQNRDQESAASFEVHASPRKTPELLHSSNTYLYHSICDLSNSRSANINQSRSESRSRTPTFQRGGAWINACQNIFHRVYAHPLRRSAAFWMTVSFCTVSWMAFLIPLTFVPALIKERGLTDDDGAFFASLMSLLDIPSRLFPGIIVNTGYLKATTVTVLPWAAVGVVGFFTPLMNTYNSLLILVIVYGLFSGVYMTTQTLIVIEMVGLKHYPFVLAICYLAMSIASSSFFPIAGLLKDMTGTYSTPYYVMSSFNLVSVVMLLCLPAVRRFDVRRGVLE